MTDEGNPVVFISNEKPTQIREKWSLDNRELLLDTIMSSPCPTPWKPQHGTNKEVWNAIVDRFNAQKHITGFTTNVSWESAKDQFISMLDRQRRQKKKGSLATKLDTINAIMDGQAAAENSVTETKKTKSSYEVDERHKKLPKKSPVVASETSESSVEIERLRLQREKEHEEAQKQRDERFASILESHLEANKAVLEQVVSILDQVKHLLATKDISSRSKK